RAGRVEGAVRDHPRPGLRADRSRGGGVGRAVVTRGKDNGRDQPDRKRVDQDQDGASHGAPPPSLVPSPTYTTLHVLRSTDQASRASRSSTVSRRCTTRASPSMTITAAGRGTRLYVDAMLAL